MLYKFKHTIIRTVLVQYITYGTNAFTALCIRTANEDCQRSLFNLATSAGVGTSVCSARL